MTTLSNAVENVDGNHYGSKIEIPACHPGMFAAGLKWQSGFQHKRDMMNYAYTLPMISLCRDFDSIGSISIDSKGEPRIHYSLSKHDETSLIEGSLMACNILAACGASTISTCQDTVQPYTSTLNPGIAIIFFYFYFLFFLFSIFSRFPSILNIR